LSYQTIEIDTTDFDVAIPETLLVPKVTIEDTAALKLGKIKCHSSKQGVLRHRNKSPLGDFYTDKARILADLIKIMVLMNCAFR
jgi:sulfite reductase (ferredoxin)